MNHITQYKVNRNTNSELNIKTIASYDDIAGIQLRRVIETTPTDDKYAIFYLVDINNQQTPLGYMALIRAREYVGDQSPLNIYYSVEYVFIEKSHREKRLSNHFIDATSVFIHKDLENIDKPNTEIKPRLYIPCDPIHSSGRSFCSRLKQRLSNEFPDIYMAH